MLTIDYLNLIDISKAVPRQACLRFNKMNHRTRAQTVLIPKQWHRRSDS